MARFSLFTSILKTRLPSVAPKVHTGYLSFRRNNHCSSDMEYEPETSHTEPLHWRKISPTCYTRPLDPAEHLIWGIIHDPNRPGLRSLDPYINAVIDTYRTPDEIAKTAKNAWMRLRYLHPDLAASVTFEERLYHAMTHESDVEEWLEKTFVVKDCDSEIEVQGGEDLSITPSGDLPMLYYLPRQQRFILRASHMILDGTGAIALMQNFFAEMSRLDSGGKTMTAALGTEVQNLAPGPFDATGITPMHCSSPDLISSFPEPRKEEEACNIPSRNDKLDPGAAKTQSVEFSGKETLTLLNEAKRLRLGITSFTHAAVLHAAKKMSPDPRNTTHSTIFVFNFRGKHAEQSDPSLRAVSLRVGLWPVQIAISDNIQSTASVLKHEYTALAQRKPGVIAAMIPYMQQSASVLSKQYTEGPIPSFHGNLSQAFPERYSSFKVRSFWMTTEPADKRIYVGISTFGNKLSIRASYNETYYQEEQIAKYLGYLKQELYDFGRLSQGLPDHVAIEQSM